MGLVRRYARADAAREDSADRPLKLCMRSCQLRTNGIPEERRERILGDAKLIKGGVILGANHGRGVGDVLHPEVNLAFRVGPPQLAPMRALLSLFVGKSVGREFIHRSRGMRCGFWFCFGHEFLFCWVIHSTILLGLARALCWVHKNAGACYVCSIRFAARFPARSCSAVKTCPQVLHRHFEVDLPGPPAPGVPRAFSLGLNAIASSPPHPRHIRFSIFVRIQSHSDDTRRGSAMLIRIERSSGSHCRRAVRHFVNLQASFDTPGVWNQAQFPERLFFGRAVLLWALKVVPLTLVTIL